MFLCGGFLFGYVATRTFFTLLFSGSDLSVNEKVDNLPSSARKALSQATVSFDAPPPTLDASATRAADALQGVTVTPDASPESLTLIGKAKLMAGKWDAAVQAYKKAVEQNLDDPGTLIEYAYALNRTGHSPLEVQKQLDIAVNLVKAGGDKNLKRRVYEAATYSALYLPAPDGFEKAIQLGEEYTGSAANPSSGQMWVNLACGYGQKVRWLKGNRPAEDTKPFRDKALAAAQAAIAIDTRWKATLLSLLEPSEAQAAQGENDLEVFREDREFQAAIH